MMAMVNLFFACVLSVFVSALACVRDVALGAALCVFLFYDSIDDVLCLLLLSAAFASIDDAPRSVLCMLHVACCWR